MSPNRLAMIPAGEREKKKRGREFCNQMPPVFVMVQSDSIKS